MAAITSELNQFGGRVIDTSSLPADPEEFKQALSSSLKEWRADGAKVVWLELSSALSRLVPIAVEAGFLYHHADDHSLQLTKRLRPGSFVPPYATHYVGAGGVVISEEEKLLVVVERHRSSWGRHYKLPGGTVRPDEHISDAVMREVREETGIETRFRGVVCFRHWHGYRFGKSDLYFVCRLDPVSTEIRRDPGEIEECLWMPLQEYLAHPAVHAFNRTIVEAALAHPGIPRGFVDGYGTPETHELFLP